jgi:hypothetical protein
MMPDINREERRKKRAPVLASILTGTFVISFLLIPPGWQWLPLAVGTSAAIAVGASIDMPVGRRRGPGVSRRGRGSGVSARGRDDVDGPADAAAHRWRTLAMMSRLMPRAAGRRWLAEADSLLSEIEPVRRGAAIRSYLLSAPWLAVMMWAREVLRWTRVGPRRPG